MSNLMDIGTIDFVASRHLHELRNERDQDLLSAFARRHPGARSHSHDHQSGPATAAGSVRVFVASGLAALRRRSRVSGSSRTTRPEPTR
jgi:hypothetical protein